MRCLIASLIVFIIIISQDNNWFYNSRDDNECTIAVIGGSATVDGRPILWKNRDVRNADQKYLYIPGCYTEQETTFAYIGNFYADDSTRCFMGINECGFAVVNANCYNLPDSLNNEGLDDGDIMHWALQRCRDITDWEMFLDLTNELGREDPWIFGVIDSYGGAVLYECGNFSWIKYDTKIPANAPDGVIVRTTFALSGNDDVEGIERYKRACHLFYNRPAFRPIDIKYFLQTIIRDFACDMCNPYPLPYYGQMGDLPVGFIDALYTINRYKTRSCSLIRGVLEDENPKLATTFAILGQPALSIAIPLWVASEEVPIYLNGEQHAPWYDIISERMKLLYPLKEHPTCMNTLYLLDSTGAGVYSYTLPLEDWGVRQAEQNLRSWRNQIVNPGIIRSAQMEICGALWQGFVNESDSIIRAFEVKEAAFEYRLSNYPNPFNVSTTIYLDLNDRDNINTVSVNIYNILGQKVAGLGEVDLYNGYASVTWNGCDDSGMLLASGVYFYCIENPRIRKTGKMILLR